MELLNKALIILIISGFIIGFSCELFAQENVAEMLERGKKYYEAGDFDRAITEMRKALEALEKMNKQKARIEVLIDAHTHLGMAYVGVGNIAKAKEQFKETVRLDPARKLSSDYYSPKIISIFNEAREEVLVKEKTARPAVPPPSSGVSLIKPQTLEPAIVWGRKGEGDGEFISPAGIAVSARGRVYITDIKTGKIQVFDREGKFLASWGEKKGKKATDFQQPWGIAVDDRGGVYLTEAKGQRIIKFDENGKVLSSWGKSGKGEEDLSYPTGIAVSKDYIYVADARLNRIQVYNKEGKFIRNIGKKGKGDGEFNSPFDVTLDRDGNIYVLDTSNQRVQKFDAKGSFVLAIKKSGEGKKDPGIRKAYGLYVDKSGFIFVSDAGNDQVHIFDGKGNFLFSWGRRGSGQGDINDPRGIAGDDTHHLYLVDAKNERIQRLFIK